MIVELPEWVLLGYQHHKANGGRGSIARYVNKCLAIGVKEQSERNKYTLPHELKDQLGFRRQKTIEEEREQRENQKSEVEQFIRERWNNPRIKPKEFSSLLTIRGISHWDGKPWTTQRVAQLINQMKKRDEKAISD